MSDKLALQYFEYDANEAKSAAPSRTVKIKCLSCSSEIRYDGSTGNLIKHLRTNPHIHSGALQHYFEQKKDRAPPHRKRKYDSYASMPSQHYYNNTHPFASTTSSPTLTPPTTTTPPTLAADFNSYLLKLENLTNYQQLDVFNRKPVDDALTAWLCIDPTTSSIVLDSVVFKEFLFQMNPGYTPLTRQQFLLECMPKLCTTMQARIADMLKECMSVNVVCDVWSKGHNDAKVFVTYSAHTIDANWKPIRFTLKCIEYDLNASGMNDICDVIFRKFNECMAEYGIGNKVVKVITDDGSCLLRILKAYQSKLTMPIDQTDIDELLNDNLDRTQGYDDCEGDSRASYEENCSQMLNDDYAVDGRFNDGLDVCNTDNDNDYVKVADEFANMDFGTGRYVCAAHQIQTIINDAIKFIEFEKLFEKCRNIFRKAQTMQSFRMKLRSLRTTCTNPTGFISIYVLVKAVLGLNNRELEYLIAAKNGSVRMTMLEREKLKEIAELFEDLYICLNHISSKSGDHVTISKILPAIRTVLHHLANQSFKHFDKIRVDLIRNIERTFSYLENDFIFGIASMLDPNYSLSWCPPQERKIWFDRLKAYVTLEADKCQIKIEQNLSTDQSDQISHQSPMVSNSKWFITFQDDYENDYDKIEKSLNTFFFKCKSLKINTDLLGGGSQPNQTEQVDVHIDLLKFWKEYENENELLSRIARRLLSIPASAPNMQKFITNNFLTNPSNCLSYDPCKLVFIRNNKDLIVDVS